MKYSLLFISLVLVFAMVSCQSEEAQEPEAMESMVAGTGEPGYAYKIDVDKMAFNWAVNNGQLKVKLAAETEGWVGIGFNPSEQMKDANFVIGFVKDGEVTVSDEHGIENKQHTEDTDIGGTADIMDYSGSEDPSGTEIAFTIPLAASDSLDKPIDTTGEITVLLAYGRTDRLAQQHVMRSELKVNLSTGDYTVLYVRGQP